jgi:FkbM family methyltransferase
MFEKLKRLLLKRPSKTLDHFLSVLGPKMSGFKYVFDVGAYHGSFAEQVSKLNPAVAIHVFEPFTASCELIRTKFKNNPAITVNHAAVSDMEGTAVLHINAFAETNSLLASGEVADSIDALTKSVNSETVSVITLDSYCESHGIEFIDMIKIDTQGNSYQVLKGMEKMLSEKKVGFLYVEAEFVEIYKNEKLFSEIELLMRGYGYSIDDLYNLNYINNEKLGWCDILFSPKKF